MKKTLLSAVIVATLAGAAMAEGVRTVAATGVGRVSAAPNVAVVTLSFINTAALDVSRADLLAKNTERAEPALAAVKELVGKDGSVRSSVSVRRDMEYDQQKRAQVATGHTITRTIEVTLRGDKAISAKLAKLYDNGKLPADDVSEPSYGISDRRDAAVQRKALKLAYANAVDRAQAQLEAGEKLGHALARGTQATLAPRASMKLAAAMAMPEAAPMGGSPTVESGKLERQASTSVLFEVKGRAKRAKK